MLVAIKLLHTLIWAALAGCVLAVPFLGLLHRFRLAAILSVIALAECLVLGVNGGKCPLTDWAGRFTTNRGPNFDIYLPALLAQYNKLIFGSLFVVGEVVLLTTWVKERSISSLRKHYPGPTR